MTVSRDEVNAAQIKRYQVEEEYGADSAEYIVAETVADDLKDQWQQENGRRY